MRMNQKNFFNPVFNEFEDVPYGPDQSYDSYSPNQYEHSQHSEQSFDQTYSHPYNQPYAINQITQGYSPPETPFHYNSRSQAISQHNSQSLSHFTADFGQKRSSTLNLNTFLSIEPNDEFEFAQISNLEQDFLETDLELFLLNQHNQKEYEKYEKEYQKNEKNEDNQIYRPKHIRGIGIYREGYCQICNKWFRLKTSSYWYHMNYKHGINSKGKKYPEPDLREFNNKIESFCTLCNNWIVLSGCKKNYKNGERKNGGNKNGGNVRKNIKNIKYSWFRHFQKVHVEY